MVADKYEVDTHLVCDKYAFVIVITKFGQFAYAICIDGSCHLCMMSMGLQLEVGHTINYSLVYLFYVPSYKSNIYIYITSKDKTHTNISLNIN